MWSQGWAQPARPARPYLHEAFAAQKGSEAKLRQFLADASHELRTPLTSIQGFAELFRLGVANEHVDTDVIMRRIEEESKRMRVLVDDLLLLARLDERRDIEPSRVDLAVLAADACSDAVAVDPDRHITLDAPESVPVDGVQDHLRQAIANLVSGEVRARIVTDDSTGIGPSPPLARAASRTTAENDRPVPAPTL